MARGLRFFLGGAAAAGLFLMAQGAAAVFADTPASNTQSTRAQAPGDEQQGPIEILIVQGYIKSIDSENLVLTAPGAPADLPLKLAPDTRFIEEEGDISRDSLHEGSLVRAALVPMGEDYLAVVVELVPDEELPEGAPESPEAPTAREPSPSRL